MNKLRNSILMTLLVVMSAFLCGIGHAAPVPPGSYVIDSTGYYVPDYFATSNWANSPQLVKFIDDVAPLGCGAPTATLGQCIPIAVADQATYPGSDYYEIELVQYREQLHSGLPPVTLAGSPAVGVQKMDPAAIGGTLLRGYRQTNGGAGLLIPHYLGPLISAKKYDPNYAPDAVLPSGGTNGRPVRIKFKNSLSAGAPGKLFVPVDTTIMGSGPYEIDYDPVTNATLGAPVSGTFPQNRATLHLHGGRTPWISDGTAHQWITPAAEAAPNNYGKGVSVEYVPDMWFLPDGTHVTACAGMLTCAAQPTATNNPGPGSQTFYFTNQQSARLLFYHDHAWGITRLNVYVGEAAGYLITDVVEEALVTGGTINGRAFAANTIPATQVPLIIQDKTFVDAGTVMTTDPTWAWGSSPAVPPASRVAVPVTGDLWWPHVYMPAQNPFVISGASDFGRWHYGPWFFPSTPQCGSIVGGEPAVKPFCIDFGPVANEYYGIVGQPPERPGTPNPSWGAEAFLDTMLVNGTAYPKLSVPAGPVRFRILNASHDRFLNLQMYRGVNKVGYTNPTLALDFTGGAANLTEVAMVPASYNAAYPAGWPVDGREGGVPHPDTRGPAFIQIGTEGGFLPQPVVLPNQPVVWNTDPTLFNVGNVLQQNEGGGTLFLGPAERADVIVDFTDFAGHTLILYNDAPTAFPALVGQYDYYTGAPDRSDVGGYASSPGVGVLPGVGPNVRTVMQITVGGAGGLATPDSTGAVNLATLNSAFVSAATPGVFASSQDPIIVGQPAYNATYNAVFPETSPQGRLLGVSRISDGAISFNKVDGSLMSNFQMKAKAIHDEMGATFDDYGRMSAKLGLEMPFTNAQIANFILQNFVDPATEIVRPDEIQIWRITHNGVDAHPIHFHLFDVQVLNRVGWDGFIRLPDANELGWKDTVRMHPLEDTIVALRPVAPKVPFALPNSVRPLNPAKPLGSWEGFSQIDTTDGGDLVPPQINRIVNFGHEYVWHCHILSHEENDMMRPIIFNVDQLLYMANEDLSGIVQWELGTSSQLTASVPASMVASGANLYATFAGAGLYQWNGSAWSQINSVIPASMVASGADLYATFTGDGLYRWNGSAWSKITGDIPESMVASGANLYATFTGEGLYQWNGSAWSQLTGAIPANMVASGANLYTTFTGVGLYQWNGSTWSQINGAIPANMVAAGTNLYATFTGAGFYQWNGSTWSQINSTIPANMVAAGANLFADFTGAGLYHWNGSAWSSLTPINPTRMFASGSVLYADLGTGTGVFKWENGSWTQINASSTIAMVPGF